MELERPALPDAVGLDEEILAATVRARLFGGQPFCVGRFALEGRIGSGGMGVVYLGRDPDLQRPVAIKLLRPDLTLGDATHARARMLREAQAMARLRHPNVVVVHEVGEHDGGIYLAMEYVPGTTLRGWLAASPRTPREILAAYVQAGRGLAAAHAASLVHRDLKPDNVLVGEDGRICVTDFGLATMPADIVPATASDSSGEHPRHASAITLSSSGGAGIAGTLAYMAPECLDARPATAASDQYSFCTALYEALWGRRPHGDTLESIATAFVERRPPVPPRERGVSRGIRAAVLRGLSHDPRERFPDMAALLAAL
ncbi:MAG: serine/threonine protein kinase, partial [Deltaproteobacteria bacterium]|nr:serine/threonine protein kinase [Nannocystaceae bacterium]